MVEGRGRDRATLPRSERLSTRSEFQKVREAGRSRAGRLLVVVHRRGAGRCFGVACGRGVGGAVERNRLRRLVREAYRRNRCRVPQGVWLLVIIRTAAAGEGYREVEAELLGLLARGGLLRE